jgi:hypothetical protein
MREFVKYSGVIAISLLLASGLAGCGGGLFERDKPQTDLEILQGQEGRTLWETKLQYVRIVDRDIAGIVNEHPTAISPEEMRIVLESIYVTERSGIIGKSENPIFSPGELQVLSTALANGFNQVQPNEDINFVTIGSHKGLISKEQKTTSGRVFISDGRLNIIFGLIHEVYRDNDPITQQPIDRRLHPLVPGTRKFDSKPPIRIALDKGQSNYLDAETGKERTDWLILDIATVLKTAEGRKGDDIGAVSPELLEDVARSKQETGNLRHDVSNIKEILFELSDEIERLKQQIEVLKSKP